ncbi:MAG: 7-carboxy-7-deazaguanine synthase QueE [Pseudomonadota bacterium]
MVSTATATLPAADKTRRGLKITEIFTSIQGESDLVGWPTVFVRLTGCPLRCRWCDTPYSFGGGEWMSIDSIVEQVKATGVRRVCVTGGEPLTQKRCLILLSALCDAGCIVSLETSGALSVAAVDHRVIKVMDLKAPGSLEVDRNEWANLDHLQPHDQIKIVIADRRDFDWAIAQVRQHTLDRWQVLFSPVNGELRPRDLAEWILAEQAPVRLQLQLHKYLWGDEKGR